MKRIVLHSLFVLFCAMNNPLQAQTNLSGTINSYAKVTAVDTCQQTLTVSSTAGFMPNLKILLIQMKGALMDESNNSNFGTLSSLRNAGKYEINTIDSISGNVIFLKYKNLTDYDVNHAVQIVSYPTYTTATVQNNLTATPWDGQTGGIIAFEATTLNLNANIDASATGFLGGAGHGFNIDCACQSPTCLSPANDYFYNAGDFKGAFKGEGISTLTSSRESGRGRQNNGGGGGNDHKSGGGGGGNVGNGGNGGINAEPLSLRCKGAYPGIGGQGLAVANNNNRLFWGGGGGAGHTKGSVQPNTAKGGNGGGIILIKANTLNANTKSIKANGENGTVGSSQGGGGGGAGGTILLEGRIVGALTLETKGGIGGNSDNGNADRCTGPGGGGGGGKILLKTTGTTPTSTFTGGIAGQSINSTESCNTGGGAGSGGQVATLTVNDNIAYASETVSRSLAFNRQPSSIAACPTRNFSMSVAAVGVNIVYQWEVGQAAGGFQPISNDVTYTGAQTATLQVNNVTALMDQYRYRCIITNCTGNVLISTVGTLTVSPAANAAFTSSAAGNTITFNNQSTLALSYIWNFGDNTPLSTAQNPTHTYAAQGNYTITLKAISGCDTNVLTRVVSLNTPPIARFVAGTTDTCVHATIQFNNESSNNAAQWYWEFPGGTPSTSNQRNPIVQYFVGGAYDVTLIVSNPNGRDTLLRPQYIRVTGTPMAFFTMNRTGRDVIFTNRTAQGVSYNWDFGDATARSAQSNPSHTYNRAGTFVITLTATNNCGSSIYRDTVIMLALPTAQIAANYTQGCLPMTVQFNTINALNVNNWYWQFPGGRPRTSNIANPIIQYDTVGTWPVLLTVSNGVGTSELRDSFYIKVNNPPRPAFNIFKLSDNVISIENLTTGAQNFNWNFGDNTASTLQNPTSHRYTTPGTYNVSLLAYNQYCGRGTSQQIALNFTATEEFNQEGALMISPNPTDNVLIFNFKTPKYLGQIVQFSDVNGRIIQQFELNQSMTQTLDISTFAAGLYFIKIGNSNNVGKIIKQ